MGQSSSPMASNPNFPKDLAIGPSYNPNAAYPDGAGLEFGADAQAQAIAKYGIAGRVWEAAYAILCYLDPPDPRTEFDPPFAPSRSAPSNTNANKPLTVLELGAGTGIVGFALARRLHARDMVVVTDLPEVCPLLEDGRQRTLTLPRPDADAEIGEVRVHRLAWGNEGHACTIVEELRGAGRRLTHVVCSDLVYFPELLAPLLRTLLHLTSPSVSGPGMGSSAAVEVEVVISYKIRSLPKETPFWSAFGLWFVFAPVLVRERAGAGWGRFGGDMEGETFVFVARRRAESMEWRVPVDDGELLGGVGAGGTDVRKSDDAFEVLLLMGRRGWGWDEL
ncbi:hypothetical protein EVG20_g3580 [Dentipellis fragilis]|uniref:Uncharacterized protein n=1 Tax=Dentipellis fragilis TaxID=205917 RepID=A0A4Y9Z0Q4_9AGAM|nr:hypothetical protein EVG20_g3580 [Dentipellis fragilis]